MIPHMHLFYKEEGKKRKGEDKRTRCFFSLFALLSLLKSRLPFSFVEEDFKLFCFFSTNCSQILSLHKYLTYFTNTIWKIEIKRNWRANNKKYLEQDKGKRTWDHSSLTRSNLVELINSPKSRKRSIICSDQRFQISRWDLVAKLSMIYINVYSFKMKKMLAYGRSTIKKKLKKCNHENLLTSGTVGVCVNSVTAN